MLQDFISEILEEHPRTFLLERYHLPQDLAGASVNWQCRRDKIIRKQITPAFSISKMCIALISIV